MIRTAALLLMLAAPAPAMALSCLQPTVERSFARFDAAPESYVIVHGRLTLDMDDLPKSMTQDPARSREVKVQAHVTGSSMTTNGFSLPFDQAVTLEVGCLGPWCGSAKSGQDILAFVRKDAGGYAIEVGPCGGAIFGTPKKAQLNRVIACFSGGDCTPSE